MSELLSVEKDFRLQGSTVLEKLSEWVISKGDSRCIYYGEDDRYLTYDELNRMSNKVANGYARLGVKKGDRISVLSKNALVTTITMFAAWKLGALYCPINNSYKGDLLAYIINDTQSKVLFLDQCFVENVNTIRDQIKNLPHLVVHEPKPEEHDFDTALIVQPASVFNMAAMDTLLEAPDNDPEVSVSEFDLAGIIYTSGTTGNPKGVVQNHRWLHSYNYLSLKLHHPDTVIYNDLPLYHVGGAYFNVVRAIWSGCQLALWDRFSPNEFWHRIHKSGATFAQLMDVMIDWLLQAPPSPDDRNNSLFMVGMNPLPANHHEVAKRFGFDFISAGYGSSEIGVGFFGLIDEFGDEPGTPVELQQGFTKDEWRQLYRDLNSKSVVSVEASLKKGFMGVPSPLVEVAVQDGAGKPVAPGAPGQAAFRSRLPDIFFREYFNKPEATHEAMQDGWYHPADIISYDENGLYYFEDRKQGFIRVRGENVSATTVEQQLDKHPMINRSAVVGVPASQGNEEDLAVFIVLKPDAGLSAETLRSWTRQVMPKFMQPKHIRFIDALPVTPTFKVERYKLKQIILAELT